MILTKSVLPAYITENQDVKVYLINSNCDRYTFKAPKIRQFVIDHCEGYTLNLFAGATVLEGVNEFRVDLDPELDNIDYRGDANDYLEEAKNDIPEFDTHVIDPPWNGRKSKEKYGNRKIGKFTKLKGMFDKLLKPGGICITAGYEISVMGKKRGYKPEALLIVNPGGEIRPFFVIVERKNK